ncbi:hypothetical protein SH661x_002924 [Planctomicrobium sp. SH661]|uniref:hypothetical protein n=1 Tax=Planctomicrobium sp. SH661 TaxID=3448124 RepID=UPI003F5C9F21
MSNTGPFWENQKGVIDMLDEQPQRRDDVSQRYKPAERAATASGIIYLLVVFLSFALPYADDSNYPIIATMHTAFLVLGITYFGLGTVQRLVLIPYAERARCKQFLGNSFESKLSEDQTVAYYNNEFSAGIVRMGANTMENALFSEAVARKMLFCERLKAGVCAITWLALWANRFCSFEILSWITQVVFSAEVLESWLTLEVFRARCAKVYERLYDLFRGGVRIRSNEDKATILDTFAAYESAKASAGTLLSSEIFHKINPKLTEDWERIRNELGMTKAKQD